MRNTIQTVYFNLINKKAYVIAIALAVLLLFLSQYTNNFRLNASSDSLVLENDKSLEYFRNVVSKYNTSDILLLTYSPKKDLFSNDSLDDLTKITESLKKLDGVNSILSIVDVPLTQSPPVTLAQLNGGSQLLLDEKTDIELAKKEFLTSPLYSKLLLSDDLSTTAIVISLDEDDTLNALTTERNNLRALNADGDITKEQGSRLKQVTRQHQAQSEVFNKKQDALVQNIRDIASEYEAEATLFLGGLPMIVSDSIRFIRGDVVKFGGAALLVIIFILVVAFRQWVWVITPLLTCGITAYVAVSLLGWLDWPISVVSSNFLSLLLIITLSLTIHLVVRYKEINAQDTDSHIEESVLTRTIQSKFLPCVYTALTTMVAFASLIVSGIRPVIDFGWIMCLGILVAVFICFTLFPVLLTKFNVVAKKNQKDPLSQWVIDSAQRAYLNSKIMTIVFILIALFAIYGVLNLTVENRFIDYFKENTEIYQGMHQIDEKLGGTTPLDIILDPPSDYLKQVENSDAGINNEAESDFEDDFLEDEGDFFEEFEDETKEQTQNNAITNSYWFNVEGINKLKAIHHSLDKMQATGKVLSLVSSIELFENLKDAKPMDDFDLGFMYQVLSKENKQTLFKPYLSEDGNQVHINIRVFESQKGLDRNQLINDIRTMLQDEHQIKDEQINISGILVLYNNMLNSLFNSQILTLGTVFFVILLMFMVLFRSVNLAIIAILPNLFSATVVLGVMGIFKIPLDLMTITIAAISVGIAVDNSIHFVHRFQSELAQKNSRLYAIDIANKNVGQAMIYTTTVITAGFLIMVFSSFVPTVYFGVLTALAMLTALFANLVMLPMLLARFAKLPT